MVEFNKIYKTASTKWIKEQEFVTIAKIQKELSVSYIDASKILNQLMEDKLIDKETIGKKGYKVLIYKKAKKQEDPKKASNIVVSKICVTCKQAYNESYSCCPKCGKKLKKYEIII